MSGVVILLCGLLAFSVDGSANDNTDSIYDVIDSPELRHMNSYLRMESEKLAGCGPVFFDHRYSEGNDMMQSCPKPVERTKETLEARKKEIEDSYGKFVLGRLSMGFYTWKSKAAFLEMSLKKEELAEKLAANFDLDYLHLRLEELHKTYPERLLVQQLGRIVDYYINVCPCEDQRNILNKMLGISQLYIYLWYDLMEKQCQGLSKIPFFMSDVANMATSYQAVLTWAAAGQSIIHNNCNSMKDVIKLEIQNGKSTNFTKFYNKLQVPIPNLLDNMEQQLLDLSLDSIANIYESLLEYSKGSGLLPELAKFLVHEVYAPTEFIAASFFNETMPHSVQLYLICSFGAQYLQQGKWTYEHLPEKFQGIPAISLIGGLFQKASIGIGKINPLKSLATSHGMQSMSDSLLDGAFEGSCRLTQGGLYLDAISGYMYRNLGQETTIEQELLKFSRSEMKKFMESYGLPEIKKFETQMKMIMAIKSGPPPVEIPAY